MRSSDRLRLVGVGIGLIVFGALMVELVGAADRGSPSGRGRGPATESAPGSGRGVGASVPDDAGVVRHPAGPADADGSPTLVERRRTAFAGGGAPRLGHRLDPSSEEFDAPEVAGIERPATLVPTSGEGAQADGWDGLASAARIDRATREVESALAKLSTAGSEDERRQWRARAAHALSAARADFYASSDEAGYAELEARIGE